MFLSEFSHCPFLLCFPFIFYKQDEEMIPFQERRVGLPLIGYRPRKPIPLGIEFKTISESKAGSACIIQHVGTSNSVATDRSDHAHSIRIK